MRFYFVKHTIRLLLALCCYLDINAQTVFDFEFNYPSLSGRCRATPSADGGYFMATKYSSNDFYMVKLDTFGNMQWNKYFNATITGVADVITTYDGGYIIYCETNSMGIVQVYKMDSLGNYKWNKGISVSNYIAEPARIKQDADSNFILCGTKRSLSGGYRGFLLKADKNNRNTIFNKEYPLPNTTTSHFYDAIPVSGGGYLAVGEIFEYNLGYGFFVARTDDVGDTLWVKKIHHSPTDEAAYSVVEADSGAFIIAGSIDNELALVKLDSSGNEVWMKTFSRSITTGLPELRLTHALSSGYLIAAASFGCYSSGSRTLLVRTGTDGSLIWDRVLRDIRSNYPYSLATIPGDGYMLSTGNNRIIKTDTLGNILCRTAADFEIWDSVLCPGETMYPRLTTDTCFHFTQFDWTLNGSLVSQAFVYFDTFYTPGTYTLRLDATDSVCTDSITRTFTIVEPTPLGLSPDTTICHGDTAIITLNDVATNYFWNPTQFFIRNLGDSIVALPEHSISYIVSLLDSNYCSVSDTVSVFVRPFPTVDIGNDTILCTPDTMVLSTGSSYSSYSWSDGSAAPTTTVSAFGSYTVTVTDTFGCENHSSITIAECPEILTTDSNCHQWEWGRNISKGCIGCNELSRVASDKFGNICLAGNFSFLLDTPSFIPYSVIGNSGRDVLIVKTSAAGEFLWLQHFGGDDDEYVNAIETDDNGNIYITGYFDSYSMVVGNDTLNNRGMYLVKLDPDGNFLWARQASAGARSKGRGLTIDPMGNIWVSGSTNVAGTTFGQFVLDDPSLFIAKYDREGNVIWAGDGEGAPAIDAISSDALGNIYVAGRSSIGFSFGLPDTITTRGSTDVFVAKLDNNGNPLWLKSFGSQALDYLSDIKADSAGNVYLCGYFRTLDMHFDSIVLPANGGSVEDYFLAKLDSSGNALWARGSQGPGFDNAIALAVDKFQNVFMTGYGSVFNNIGILPGYPWPQGVYGYLAKFDADGSLLWAKNAKEVVLSSIAIDPYYDVLVAGYSDENIIEAGTITLVNPSPYATTNLLLFKMKAASLTKDLNVYAPNCEGSGDGSARVSITSGSPPFSYAWSNDATSATVDSLVPGEYSLTVTDAGGCASITTFTLPDGDNVVAYPISGNDSVNAGQTLDYSTTYTLNHIYSWSITGGVIISGNGTPGVKVLWLFPGQGSLEVADIETGCSDTSLFNVTITPVFTGLHTPMQALVSVYPNPSQGVVTIRGSGFAGAVTLAIFNTMNQLIFNGSMDAAAISHGKKIDLSGFPQGVYQLVLTNHTHVSKARIVKM